MENKIMLMTDKSEKYNSSIEPVINVVIGTKKAFTDEINTIFSSMQSLYSDCLTAGRNNNSEFAVKIREYTEEIIEILENLQLSQNNKKYLN
jgi:hypothetical protein